MDGYSTIVANVSYVETKLNVMGLTIGVTDIDDEKEGDSVYDGFLANTVVLESLIDKDETFVNESHVFKDV